MSEIIINHYCGPIPLNELEADARHVLANGGSHLQKFTPETVMALINKIKEMDEQSRWTTELPQEVGTYAMVEGFDSRTRTVTKVTTTAQSELIYGGMRMVEHAPPGTLWLRVADIPDQDHDVVPAPSSQPELSIAACTIPPKDGVNYQDNEVCGLDSSGKVMLWSALKNKSMKTHMMPHSYFHDEMGDAALEKLDEATKSLGLIKDEEVWGLAYDGQVVQWSAEDRALYACGENVESFGVKNLTPIEIARVRRDAEKFGLTLPPELFD
jgi:hypothetical protein